MHQVSHGPQHGAQLAAGVEGLEVLGGETALFQQGHGQGVAKGHLQGGRGCRRIDIPRRFSSLGQQKLDVCGPAQGAVGGGGQRDHRDLEALGIGQDVGQFPNFARLGQGQDHVVLTDHAQVAMAGFIGVDKVGRGARGREGGGDLAGYMPGLSDSGADDPAPGLGQDLNSLGEGVAQGPGLEVQGVSLGAQHPATDGDGVELAHWVGANLCACKSISACLARAALSLASLDSRDMAAFISGVCCSGVWPKGPGERSPRPCGQTMARPTSPMVRAIRAGRKSRSNMSGPI